MPKNRAKMKAAPRARHQQLPIVVFDRVLSFAINACTAWIEGLNENHFEAGDFLQCRFQGHTENSDYYFSGNLLFTYAFQIDGKMGRCYGLQFKDSEWERLSRLMNPSITVDAQTRA